jgi:DNA-directed RNA polymerase subunit K/omega
MFDKLVEDAENEIARLKKPVPQRYELVRVEEKK